MYVALALVEIEVRHRDHDLVQPRVRRARLMARELLSLLMAPNRQSATDAHQGQRQKPEMNGDHGGGDHHPDQDEHQEKDHALVIMASRAP